jgi:SAM-dependent methyltransferase
MATELPYLIRGGHDGRERLRILTRAMHPATTALLDRVGIPAGASCLDVGCGAGDVTRELAARAGDSGRVVGVDVDEDVLAIARDEAAAAGLDIEYRRADVTRERLGAGFDVAYARFLLTHLVDPAAACRRIARSLRPGGTVIVEDIDIAASFCHPPSSAFLRYLEIYAATAHARGGDPHIAPRLPALLRGAGFERVRAWVAQPIGLATEGVEGAVKLVSPLTLVNIADAAIAEGVAGKPELRP